MRRRSSTLLRHQWVGFLVFCCAAWSGLAQSARRIIEEPQWLKGHITGVSAGVFTEGTFEETTFDNSSTKVSHDRFFVGPTVGLTAAGSIYHPNLARYTFDTEFAYGWADESTHVSGMTITRQQWEWLGRLNGVIGFLRSKPYNGEIFANYDHGYRDYDFFNRVTVDSARYGARVAYNIGNVYLNASYTHREEEVTGQQADSRTEDDTVTFGARHERKTASTSFNYTFNQYSRLDLGPGGIGTRAGEGTDHTVALSDYERFGSREQFTLNSSASYIHRDADIEQSDQVTGNANLAAEHHYNLSSVYDLVYDHFETGSFTSDGIAGYGELHHQLYESLNSGLIVRGGDSEASDDRSDGYTRRYGGGFSEVYTKRLGGSARVRFSNSLLVDHIDQQSVSTVENERHSFDEGSGPPETFFLNGSRIQTVTIVITDQNDSQPPFARGIDYGVVVNGDRTLITRPAGSRIGPNQVVLVDYRSEPGSAGSYESLSESFQIRFELYTNLWGIYGRLNLWRNNADEDLRVPNLTSYAFGTDLSWRWFRAGLEYEIYDSDLSEYRAARAFQTAVFNLDQASALSLDFTEAWIDYVDANRQETDFRFISRYHQSLSSQLRVDIEGGVDLRQGDNVDQTLATVRPGIEYVIGKTTVKAGYDFEYNLFDREERIRHLFFFRARRTF
jgi:hypothetical protein